MSDNDANVFLAANVNPVEFQGAYAEAERVLEREENAKADFKVMVEELSEKFQIDKAVLAKFFRTMYKDKVDEVDNAATIFKALEAKLK
jgi:hypothetical protein